MWTCPRCGAKLVQRNMSHACGPYTVEGYRVEEPLRGWFVHHLRVFPEDELDAELAAWVCESHEMMGRRKRLAR